MPKSYYQSIILFMAYDEFCTIASENCNLIVFSINSNLSLVSGSLIDTSMPW